MDDLFVKIFLAVFFSLYIKVAFVWPTLRVWRKAGINPFVFGKEDTAHNYIGKWFKIIIALIILAIAIFIIGDPAYSYLLPAHYLDFKWARVVSIVLCFISLLVTMMGHFDMAQSWRIGIDGTNEVPRVQTGLFRFSGNPVFPLDDRRSDLYILSHAECDYATNHGFRLCHDSIAGMLRGRIFVTKTWRDISAIL